MLLQSGTRSKWAIEALARFVAEKTAEDGPLDAIAEKIFSYAIITFALLFIFLLLHSCTT